MRGGNWLRATQRPGKRGPNRAIAVLRRFGRRAAAEFPGI